MDALILAAALALGAGEPALAWERPPAIPAETEMLQDRLGDPQHHFLLDSQHGFLSGREFYQAQGEVPQFLWPAHPWMRLLPDRRWLKDSALVDFRALVGNEVGDPLLGELSGDNPGGNRTPMTTGSVTWSPTGEWGLNAGLDQNDHFSYRTFPARLALAGEERWDELSWIGGNLPPKSQAHLGGVLHRHGGLLSAQFNRGWWWTASPVSGKPYPWKGFNADFHTRAGDDFDLSLVDQSWESAAPGSFQAARWRRTEMTLGFAGGSRGGWRWRLELGGQRRTLYADSAFPTFEEDTYPWRFRYRQNWSPDEGSPLKAETQGSFGVRERMVSAQHATDLRQTWGPHQLGQTVKAYYRNPLSGYREPLEILDPDTLWTAALEPGRHARGLAGGGEYRYRRSAFQASLAGFYAVEWGTPVFRGAIVDTVEGLLIRAGAYRGGNHAFAGFGGRFQAGGRLWRPASWRLQGGLRGFEGKEAGLLEFRPSPWWMGGGLACEFPSRLRLESLVHWMGPKEVRGWGPVFEVPSHVEGNLALIQSLFGDRLELSAAFLHAFGEEVLEHPNGNPLVFRILAGAKGSF